MELRYSGRIVDIDVEDGVYILNDSGSSGKSYLKHILSNLNALGEKVYALDYKPGMGEEYYLSDISHVNNMEVILLDRFDLYGTNRIVSEAAKHAKRVLVDWKDVDKRISEGDNYYLATVDFDSKGIVVV